MWTKFYDMSSGGREKTPYSEIFIELPIGPARKYFAERFQIDPDNITCECCGPDFDIQEQNEEPAPITIRKIYFANNIKRQKDEPILC